MNEEAIIIETNPVDGDLANTNFNVIVAIKPEDPDANILNGDGEPLPSFPNRAAYEGLHGVYNPYTYIPSEGQRNYYTNNEWGPHFTPLEMNLMVRNYWGDLRNERFFWITFERAQELIQASTELSTTEDLGALGTRTVDNRSLALRIENITDRDIVNGEWISFDRRNYSVPEDVDDNTTRIYKLDPYFFRAYQDGEDIEDTNNNAYFQRYIRRSLTEGDLPFDQLIIVGRIIRQGDGTYGVIMIVAGVVEAGYQLEKFTTAGPDGHGGGGAWP